MNSRLGNQVESIETFTDTEGQPVYYVVYLHPSGFVIVPADDEVEPVVCFSSGGSYDPSERNPLGAIVSRDLPGRVNAARVVQKKAYSGNSAGMMTERETSVQRSSKKAFGKWMKLLAYDNNTPGLKMGPGSVSDVRVAPLLQTKWGQDIVCGNACFNYYTPPGSAGNANNYYCGCVATAMAQYMRFRQYPTAGVGTGHFTISVDGHHQTMYLRGGDGSGSAYLWSQMSLVPDCGTTLEQRQAIGALTYDAGVAVGMDYEADGSSASTSDAAAALVSTFGYNNAIYGYNNEDNIGSDLNAMVNPNLDWGNPVILGVSSADAGHEIVADGYGYNGLTLYHHLNMGWDGDQDVWYNLPNIDSLPSFNVVDEAIYNIYISGTGEIISGRVMVAGAPIAEASVTASKTGGGDYTTTTNSNGIYAIPNVPSNSNYTVSVAKSGYSFTSQMVSTGLSEGWHVTSGNCWAIDFTGILTAQIPVASDSSATVESGVPTNITLQAVDNGLPNPPGALTYTITSLPSHGTLADPCADKINSVPYSLVNFGNNVVYTPVTGYAGLDSFRFKANDGGSPPTGGNSNVAAVSVTVQPPSPQIIYETGFDTGLPAGWTIVHGGSGSSSDTWRSDNPGGWSSPYWTGVFMIVDSDYAGTVDMDEQLITQSIDCTDLSGVKLKFNHDFYHYSNEIGDVDVRVNGGVWRNVKRYRNNDYAGSVELALSGFGADGDPNVQIRWHYYKANYDYYWGIDDVEITASHIVPIVTVKKCTVSAGSKANSDTISFSGTMNATLGNISAVDAIEVTVDSNDINSPSVKTFPINDMTFKKSKYNCSKTEGTSKTSFTFDTKTSKFSFTAKNVDLSGLSCPLTMQIKIGDYNATAELDETVVNGPKKPIPILLMMGIKDVLRVDKCQVKHGKKLNTDQLSVSGGFAVEDPDVNMASEDLVITLDTQQFTIPASSFKAGKGKFTCSKVKNLSDGSIAAANFNFNTCSFTLTIKNANIPAISGDVDFCMAFAGFNQCAQITLP